ncbi:Hypothetical predicted protein [Pelobates cultripes]|uniref:Uncharacterized protein n=1 Tax=Pelobates cultripes TaxID=61616 RepID=A0AAD1RHB7_PELCU|nr:Hypothetical predicted protein [Pelobates cultripes]
MAYSGGEWGGRPLLCLPSQVSHTGFLRCLLVPLNPLWTGGYPVPHCGELKMRGTSKAYLTKWQQHRARYQRHMPCEAPPTATKGRKASPARHARHSMKTSLCSSPGSRSTSQLSSGLQQARSEEG